MKPIYLWLFCLLIPACGSAPEGPEQYIPRYEFPQKSVISDLPEHCAKVISNPIRDFGKMFESAVMDGLDVQITPEEERSFGRKIKAEIDKELRYAQEQDPLQKKLQSILQKMLPFAQRKDLSFSIRLVEDTSTVNAWTHSGGYIYVTRALISFTESTDELAFVIAHELAHHENRHCDKTLRRIKAATTAFGDNDFSTIAHTVFSWVMAPFDQDQEIEADLAALYLSYRAGFDPEKGLPFFTRLAANEDVNELGKMLNSHPYSADRHDCVMGYLRAALR
jgi:beta-barrel assembly-enhancing protease